MIDNTKLNSVKEDYGTMKDKKVKQLIDIAHLYYEENKTQNEIARLYDISRPLVSRLLKDARDCGIVRIEIGAPPESYCLIQDRLHHLFHIKNSVFVPSSDNDSFTNDLLAKAAIQYMVNLKQEYYGIGWGHIIGNMIDYMEQHEPIKGLAGQICPLIGNSGMGNRNYHSNELVRIFALQTNSVPEYLYAPAFVSSRQELNLMKELENCKSIQNTWDHLQVALVNIGNYPSTPDFASAARYGSMLTTGKAVGRMLGYFFDAQGSMFHSDTDYMLQIPLESLAHIPHVIGFCSSNTNPVALLGALRSGYINHLIAREDTVQSALKLI